MDMGCSILIILENDNMPCILLQVGGKLKLSLKKLVFFNRNRMMPLQMMIVLIHMAKSLNFLKRSYLSLMDLSTKIHEV